MALNLSNVAAALPGPLSAPEFPFSLPPQLVTTKLVATPIAATVWTNRLRLIHGLLFGVGTNCIVTPHGFGAGAHVVCVSWQHCSNECCGQYLAADNMCRNVIWITDRKELPC
ncbi:hypothetical protein ACK12G_26810 [Mycolicibacterium wolinskyi]|uniref:hypothetical protein n=1 Tax=Mycolicibacterium wolinskyi TaxID=59750 RepID=UPI00391793B8